MKHIILILLLTSVVGCATITDTNTPPLMCPVYSQEVSVTSTGIVIIHNEVLSGYKPC